MSFQVWIKLSNNEFRTYNNETKEFKTSLMLKNDINSFYIPTAFQLKAKDKKKLTSLENDEYIDKLLKKYSKHLIKDREQFLNCESMRIKFDIFDSPVYNDKKFYRTTSNIIMAFFKILTKKSKYENIEKINFDEYNWFEKTKNCGLIFTKTGTYNSYGYDFKNYYGSILGNKNSEFKIPTKKGLIKQLNKLPKHLQYGIYKVKITSKNDKFNKLFKFNDKNYYTHYDIKYAREFDDVDIELTLNEPNAIVYYNDDLVKSNSIFDIWFKTITSLKKELKGNSLVKLLSSGLWGHLCQSKVINKKEDDFFNDDINLDDYIILDQVFQRTTSYFQLLNKNDDLYKTDFRIKPFLTSYGRIKTAKVVSDNNLYDNLIRINTDGLIFDKEIDFTKYNDELIAEDKTTGEIEFKNINTYNKV